MASSMLTGERRCGTVRGKMTVLGKLPKPINLPSQRSENRGLDPNVEIVPKGTLTWGSRSSASATNAWASSAVALSPGDGSSSSPVSGRPSSGGSGPRPSTSGSDRSHEPTSNVWGPSSRPSSASEVLASNQISVTANRPRSAETRPGSSQLSRFAENAGENTVAWGPTGTSDQLGSASCKTSGFELSSGDFPTLGSEKNPESQIQRGHSSQGRPVSASGTLTQKDVLVHPIGDEKTQIDSGNTNTWKADSFPHASGGVPPAAENRQRDIQQSLPYPNVNMPFHHFDSWHGPPVCSPEGAWYAGGTAGASFRPPGPTGAFQIDHFAPYPAQLSAPFSSSRSVPRPGPGPGCFYPRNRDTYCPRRLPDSFIAHSCPVIPLRPGVYPSPQTYEGYYAPHSNFNNSVDGDVPDVGPPVTSGVFNQYSQDTKVRPAKFHARSGAHAPVVANDQVKSGQTVEYCQGEYKVLLKQHDGGNNKEQEKREQSVVASLPHESSSQENDWRANSRKDEKKPISGTGQFTQPANDGESHSCNSHFMKPLKELGKVSNESLMNKQENTGVPLQVQKQYPGIKKNATLMEKIEVLNNKARIADGHDLPLISSRDRLRNPKDVKFNAESLMQGKCTNDNADKDYTTCNKISHNEENRCGRKDISPQSEVQVSTSRKSDCLEDGKKAHFQVQRKVRTMQSRTDYHIKSRSFSQADDELVKKTSGRSSSEVAFLRENESLPVSNLPNCHSSQEKAEKQELHAETTAAPGLHAESSLDPDEHKAQQAKLKEMAAQRPKQLQEVAERTREQRAKACAKLEELNKHAPQSSNQNSNSARVTSKEFQHKQDIETESALQTVGTVDETPPPGSADAVKPSSDNEVKKSGAANIRSNVDSHRSKSNSASQVSAVSDDQSSHVEQDVSNHENITHKSTNRPDSNISKNRQMGYRRKHTILQEGSPGEQLASAGNAGVHKTPGEATVTELSVDSLPIAEQPPIQHKRKNNRTSRSRNKIDEVLSGSSSQSSARNEGINLGKAPTDIGKTQSALVVETVPESVEAPNKTSKNQCSAVLTSYSERSTQTSEEQEIRVINQWKPQSSRRSMTNQLGNRSGDKFHGCDVVIWAPVKTQNKSTPSEDVSHSGGTENSDIVSGHNGHDTQSSMKTKRAEMERYAPKQAGKELSHLNSHQTSSSIEQVAPSDVTAVHDEVAGQKADFPTVSKSEDGNKPNRRGRMHVSWRQKNLAGLPAVSQSSLTEQEQEQEQHQSSELRSRTGEQLKYDFQKGTNDKLESAEPVSVPSHQSIASRRQQRYKVHRGSVNSASIDSKAFQDDIDDNEDTQSLVPEMNASGVKDFSGNENQNQGGEQKRSHWQPKSLQPYSQHHRHGNRGTGNQRLASHESRTGKELHLHSMGNYPRETKDNDTAIRTGGSEIRNTYDQEAKRETKTSTDPTVQRRQLPNKQSNDEQTPKGDPHLVSPALNQPGANNGHSNREQEATYRGRDRGQDAGNYRFSRDKRKNSSQFEYQQIGSYNRPTDTYQQSYVGLEAQEGPRVYGERGHNYSRRGGHFYGRNSGTAVRVGDHNSGE